MEEERLTLAEMAEEAQALAWEADERLRTSVEQAKTRALVSIALSLSVLAQRNVPGTDDVNSLLRFENADETGGEA